MDLANLSPAPWTTTEEGTGLDLTVAILDSDGRSVMCVEGWSGVCPSTDAVHFIALARNAFDVMMRRGWGVGFADHEGPMQGWYIRLPMEMFPLDSRLYPLANLRSPDPFTALVEADKWYKANVEKEAMRAD